MLKSSSKITSANVQERERLIRILSAATFLISFQAYMVAPLIPRLAREFGSSELLPKLFQLF